jgi:rhamnosyl/mannosyltransferase
MNIFLKSVSAIIGSSPNYISSSPILKSFKDKTRCIPYGLGEIPTLEPVKLDSWRNKLPERFSLFVGAFRYYKGLQYLLEAAKEYPGNIVIVGDGPLKETLLNQAKQNNLSNVHFLGAVSDDDKHVLLHLCDSVVLPSHLRSEAFGISLIEGAQHGKPLICCDIETGTSYINVNGQTGITVPPADPDSLRNALTKIWSDQSLAERFGIASRQRFDDLFTCSKMASSYENIYHELADVNEK